MTIRYLGVLDDPGHLAPGSIYDPTHVYSIRSLDEAETILHQIYHSGETYLLRDMHGESKPGLFGASGEDLTLTLYSLADPWQLAAGPWVAWQDMVLRDPYPDYQISIGPRGGIKRERVY